VGYNVILGNRVVGYMNRFGKVVYDKPAVKETITEMVAGQAGQKTFTPTNVRVSYRWDTNRVANNDAIYLLWKDNPIVQNRLRQLNSLVFGRGFQYSYDNATQQIIDRFWRVNRLRSKLNPIMTDAQLYGETFIGLFPQKTGDVLVAVYESDTVQIDFDPSNVDNINCYYVTYKDEEKGDNETLKFMPAYQYVNNLEFATPVGKTVTKVRNALGLGKTGLGGMDGLMIHVKFNNCSSEIHGTSDFRQSYGVVNDYMDFRGDRMNIQSLYGSPMFDITIDTDDPEKITKRIDELAGFAIGSNPVHNKSEEWKPMQFNGQSGNAECDEKAMRGLICAGMGMPEHMLFNQSIGGESEDGAYALDKIAEDMQDAFGDAFVIMHKIAVSYAGGDITKVDEGQLIFPEISTMTEKAKAETYVLKVGANICSRETASYNTGHNWAVEQPKILNEMKEFTPMAQTVEGGGIMGGRFSTQVNNQDPERDDGSDDRQARADAQNISTQTFGDRKTNN